ncbi:DNA-directed RNA polymerase I subunit RPA43 [Colletotrichum orbiculare MAFF 240422]|uniref:DNA-directed RNA polymerase subunit n=1 Tax=Colletotrichum orbiculare (strain 104-T / ATCC 96160 / CBS 514.97 / LARS 414 / MAFF 240422) TaxID=1213857 RepID=N4V489_COLOR|nr:DNA-directed RNA polymerase I subunit RPA43 [Colletotrichum orbiculare MAFF 240422]
MSAIDSPSASGHKSDKKSKKDRKEKKRLREEDAEAGDERKHKRTKSLSAAIVDDADDSDAPTGSQDLSAIPATTNDEPSPEKKRKSKKDKQRKSVGEDQEDASDAEPQEKKEKKKKRKSEATDSEAKDEVTTSEKKKKEKKSKKSKAATPEPEAADEEEQDQDQDAMDVDTPAKPSKSNTTTTSSSSAKVHQAPDAPAKPQFPFFTQTVSLYLPIYPIGWDTPCTAAATQHLEPLLNRYVPDFKGVLLAYRNVAVAEQPGRRHAALSDSDRCDLVSVDEYAVGFGYVTADIDLFVPRRGAWMEGVINLENEGHIGVVCWGKFNASIESARLPTDWRWVHADSEEAANYVDDPFEQAEGADADAQAAETEHGAVRQIHTTGFWVDGNSDKVKGRVRFRIKAFDVGISGDHGYLSIEGTMLDAEGELEAVRQDAEQERRRRVGKSGGVLSKERRRMPDFAVTKFGVVEDEEEKALEKDVWDKTEPAQDKEEGDAAAAETEAFTGISTEEV